MICSNRWYNAFDLSRQRETWEIWLSSAQYSLIFLGHYPQRRHFAWFFQSRFEICLNIFKTFSKKLNNAWKKFKHWQLNNSQLLSLATSHWGNDCCFRHSQATEKKEKETCFFCTARKFQHFHRARSARTGAKRPGRHKQEAPKDPPKTRQAPNLGQKVSRRVAEC